MKIFSFWDIFKVSNECFCIFVSQAPLDSFCLKEKLKMASVKSFKNKVQKFVSENKAVTFSVADNKLVVMGNHKFVSLLNENCDMKSQKIQKISKNDKKVLA